MIELQGISRTFQVGDQPVHALRAIDLTFKRRRVCRHHGALRVWKEHAAATSSACWTGPTRATTASAIWRPPTLAEEQRARLRRDHIGFVFQSFHLIPRLSAAENVELPLVLAGVAPKERRQRVADILAAVGLTDRAHHRPDQLSGGQRQRVAIARATIMQPGLILADEPTGNLDRTSGEEVINTLETLNEAGLTLLVVTHDPAIGDRAKRRIRMDDGDIVEDSDAAG